MTQLADHPFAELFPLMPDDEIVAMAADIGKSAQRFPIVLLDGKILDGRNRYRACIIAGKTPKTQEFDGKDPLAFVVSANLPRRHLTESQRAIVAAKMANMRHGGPGRKDQAANLPLDGATLDSQKFTETEARVIETETTVAWDDAPAKPAPAEPPVSIDDAAKRLKVSPRSVRQAKTVLTDLAKTAAVEAGTVTVHAAAKQIKAAREAAKEVHRDATGYAIPDALLLLWQRRDEVKALQKLIGAAERAVNKIFTGQPDPLWGPVNMQGLEIDLRNARRNLDLAIPFAVCCTCQGMTPERCTACKGRGFLSEHVYNVCVPAEMKQVRDKSCVKAAGK